MQYQVINWPYRAEYFTHYCYVVTVDELTPEYIKDMKSYARSLGISYHQWLDHMMNLYRDYRGVIVDDKMREVQLNTVRHFEQTPDSIKYWFRDQINPRGVTGNYTRKESVERLGIWATILKARDPEAAKFWGKDSAEMAR